MCILHASLPHRLGTCRPSPCTRLSRAPWPVVTPATTMAAPSPWPSRAVGDPVVRRHHTSEAEVGAPLIPLLDLTGQCPPREGATTSRFMPSHGSAAVLRRSFRRVLTFTTGDWDSGSLAFTMSAGSNATCRTAPSGSHAFLPACSGPVGLSTAGKLVAQTPPSSVSRLNRGCADAPHGAHRACEFPRTRLLGGRSLSRIPRAAVDAWSRLRPSGGSEAALWELADTLL